MSETVPPTTADEPTTAEVEAVLTAWDSPEGGYYVTRGHVDEHDARRALVAALPLIRERIASDIVAEYAKVAAGEGATLEDDRILTAICNGLLRARRVVRESAAS